MIQEKLRFNSNVHTMRQNYFLGQKKSPKPLEILVRYAYGPTHRPPAMRCLSDRSVPQPSVWCVSHCTAVKIGQELSLLYE